MTPDTPTVVIVGRPNVGKSTLFNRITGPRRSIVGDEPGITRDRISGEAEHDGRHFELIDTGGIMSSATPITSPARSLAQGARSAGESVTPRHFSGGWSQRNHRLGPRTHNRHAAPEAPRHKPVKTLVVNKADTAAKDSLAHEFYSLGIKDIYPVSSEHGLGIQELLDHVTEGFPVTEAVEPPAGIKVAIIGRPNVGKSTLLNALTGEERSIVSPIAGTTRDAVDEVVERDGTRFVFVDTAGIRRKGKTKLMAEKLSVVMARRNIRLADIVIVVMDASEGFVALDATIAGYAHEGGRPVILVINKWDLTTSSRQSQGIRTERSRPPEISRIRAGSFHVRTEPKRHQRLV